MALNKATLKSALEIGFKQIFDNPNINNNKDAVAEQMALLISDKVDDYVKEAKIIYATGLIAPSSGGTVTGSFEGNLE